MGACKSRQTKKEESTKLIPQDTSDIKAPPGLTRPSAKTLRSDAEPYMPVPRQMTQQTSIPEEEDYTKENWEVFLEQKKFDLQHRKKGQLRQARDGSYTAEYRNMLGGNSRAPPWRKESARDFDILSSWRSAEPKSKPVQQTELGQKKRKATPLKKAILAQRESSAENPLWTKFGEHLQKVKDEKINSANDILLGMAEVKLCQDDIASHSTRIVPYGIADRCYLSDTEDSNKSQRHIASGRGLVREYVDMTLTTELESAVTDVLYRLRQLKMQDLGIGLKSRRYAVGFREVTRLLTQKVVSCLLIAPDVERTSGGALENKIASLKKACEDEGVPVIFALSRRQLGAAIQKNVTISVLALQDTRGAEPAFQKMLAEAKVARKAMYQ